MTKYGRNARPDHPSILRSYYTIVWDTVKDHIPPLQSIIEQILKDLEDEQCANVPEVNLDSLLHLLINWKKLKNLCYNSNNGGNRCQNMVFRSKKK